MAVCPADRALPDDRLPRRSDVTGWPFAPPIGRLWMAVCPADLVPLDRRLPPPDQTASTPTPCPCKRKKATP